MGLDTPEWFLPAILSIINTKLDTPSHPPVKLELSQEAANHNMMVLKAHGNSIQKLIEAHPGSFISPGAEFRPAKLLEPLLMHHHNWCQVKASLTRGSVWPLQPIQDSERVAKNIEFIACGNHKSALKYKNEYIKIIKSEIRQGWMLPLPLHYVNVLKHGELAPIGIDDKVWSEQPDGSKKVKL